jgi:succinate-semialdehyde dehydrogenase / glutarate-semialdehyde dehydrogenase
VVDCSMELGGNAPFIVFADADLQAALAGAMIAKMRNGGEACTAANRFYVEAPVPDEFSRMLAGAMADLTVGPRLEPGVEVGPLVNAATRDRAAELVEWALDDGAEVLTGGRAPNRVGYFYEPTVLNRAPPAARILGEEIFRPVAPVVAFDDVGTMIGQANDTEHGPVAYVYTRDLRRGLAVSEALEPGMVGLNRGLVSDPATPFGGVKQSGIGREGGHQGMLEFLESKYIAVDW